MKIGLWLLSSQSSHALAVHTFVSQLASNLKSSGLMSGLELLLASEYLLQMQRVERLEKA